MELLTTNAGSYPRIGDLPEQQRLRRAYAQWEKGEISDEKFEEVQNEVTVEVIQEQVRAGLDVVTDGQVRWYDQVSHFARGLEGCEINGLLRFFDTNTYFRQPVIVKRLRWVAPIVRDEFVFAKGVSPVPVKPILTGPYTLAKLSINRYYEDFSSLVADLAQVIAHEVEELVKAGAEVIQIDEPAILKNPGDFELLRAVVERLAERKHGARLALYLYFGDAAPLYDKLQELPVDALGLDFTYGKGLVDAIEASGSEKELGLGLIDARNTRIEGEKETLSLLRRILAHVEADRAYLNPSCGLEYLPRDVAFAKLKNMVTIARRAREVI